MVILLPVVDAVAFAHASGVVHRDLKPENVFLANEAGAVVPKLLDFGISHVLAGGGPRMTATGIAVGTPAYMAPETIRGVRQVDPRTDVWALGVMIHEVLAGALPFPAQTSAEMFVQIATADPVALQAVAPDVPPELARIVARCMNRDPDRRYADAGELLSILRMCRPSSSRRLGSVGLVETQPQFVEVGPRPEVAAVPVPPAARVPLVLEAVSRRASAATSSLSPAPALDVPRLVTGFACVLVALGGAGLVTMLNPWPDGWSLVPLLGDAKPDSPAARALPWALAAGALAGAAVALRSAVNAWIAHARAMAVVLVAAATLALFAASQFVRQRDAHFIGDQAVGFGGGQQPGVRRELYQEGARIRRSGEPFESGDEARHPAGDRATRLLETTEVDARVVQRQKHGRLVEQAG